jgi:hypothetical protein
VKQLCPSDSNGRPSLFIECISWTDSDKATPHYLIQPHDDVFTFNEQIDCYYFKEGYYNSIDRDKWPTMCSGDGCGKKFGVDFTVSVKNTVSCCENALNKEHSCSFAYCNKCYLKKLLVEGSARPKRGGGR